MKAEEIIAGEKFQKCIEFHGHLWPGLTIGYQASVAGLQWLNARRAVDEEIVAIVETDACCADAVQVLSGCTFGKGNFFYKDHGKMAFTFFNRNTGRGIRLLLKPDAFEPDKRHLELIQKMQNGTASKAENEEFKALHEKRTYEILEKPVEQIFDFTETQSDLPARAQIQPAVPCSRCGEPKMASKLIDKHNLQLCKACAGAS